MTSAAILDRDEWNDLDPEELLAILGEPRAKPCPGCAAPILFDGVMCPDCLSEP